jgi:Fe-S cluster assembly protein SufD
MKKVVLNYIDTDKIVQSPTEDTQYLIKLDGDIQGQKSILVNLEVSGVSCKIVCGFKLSRGQTLDLTTTVIHKARGTRSETTIRGVLLAGSVSNYVGKVVIEKTANGSVSRVDDKVLVIGEGTRNHAEPVMQIETNDVIASHSSSTGRVDENQLYYLQSRGLSREEAQNLLVDAFLDD